MSTGTADELARHAEFVERTAPRAHAEAAWDALINAYPAHPRALFAIGRRFIEQNNPQQALTFLQQAQALDQTHADSPFYIALAHRMLGNFSSALMAIESALTIDPYFFMALLSKGALLERLGKPKGAVATYKNAIKIAPPPERLSPSQRAALDHAQAMVAGHARQLAQHLHDATRYIREQHTGPDLTRFDESLDILAGVKPRRVQDPLLYYYPRLPAITFYDRHLFPWLEKLEAATPAIRAELEVVMRQDWDRFAPYIQLPPSAPVNQWQQLNNSKLWSTLFLWKDGARQEDVCARCPATAALLETLPLAHQAGFAPTVVFSVLSPHTRIPPHTGSTNVRLLAHLPLILPGQCGFRVGNETREWKMGEAWVFDDSIEHEAWNDSSEPRVIMILDVWNPLLSEAERALVTEAMLALNAFNAEG